MPTSLYVSKADADKNTPTFQLMKKRADQLDVPLIHVTDEMITLSRSEARNRAAFVKAQEAAQAIGQQVRIVADNQPDAQPSGALATKTFLKTSDTMYVTAEAMRNRATYLRLEAEAKREFLKFQPLKSWDALPPAERDALEASLKDA